MELLRADPQRWRQLAYIATTPGPDGFDVERWPLVEKLADTASDRSDMIFLLGQAVTVAAGNSGLRRQLDRLVQSKLTDEAQVIVLNGADNEALARAAVEWLESGVLTTTTRIVEQFRSSVQAGMPPARPPKML